MNDAKQQNLKQFLLLILLIGTVAMLSQFGLSSGPGLNSRNYSVDTRVNISGSTPLIQTVRLPSTVTLNAGNLTDILCNVSIRDYNGFSDIDTVNATFYISSSTEGSADNNNTHYTNSSCAPIAGQQSGYYANYSCTFSVNYYANNGTWTCHARANDTINLKSNLTNTTTINALYALNVTPLINYGNVNTGDYAGNNTANVTNLGNLPMNISVKGYGQTLGDNLSFVCDQGNLSVGVQHFAPNSSANYAQKQILNSSFQYMFNFTINKTTNASFVTNSTYWELYVDPLQVAFGQCNGTIVFQAEAA